MSHAVSDLPSVPIPEPDLTAKEILARAEGLVPMLRAQQDEAEQRGFYSEAVHQVFLAAGGSAATSSTSRRTSGR
jgi:hypothetical protein